MNCKSCGAPIFQHDSHCGYCLTATGLSQSNSVLPGPMLTTNNIRSSAIIGSVVGAYFGYPQLGYVVGSKVVRARQVQQPRRKA